MFGNYSMGYGPSYGYAPQMSGFAPSPEETAILSMLAGDAPQYDSGDAEIGYYGISYGPEVGYYDVQAAGSPEVYPTFGAGPEYYTAMGQEPAAPRPSPARFPTRPVPAGPVAVVKRDPQTSRVLFVGFKSEAAIAADASDVVESQPQDTIAPRKVIVPSTVAPNFEIQDIKVGSVSQLSSSDPIPAETFIPEAMNTDVRFDTAQISQKISFSVNNISAAAAVFRASINGFVVRL